MKNKFKLGAVALAMVSAGLFSAGAAQADAIISNGTVQIGVRDLGDLNVDGGTAANGSGTTIVGLRSVATNSDSTSPGCTCEGWGAGIRSLNVSGYANSSVGTSNVSLVSFTPYAGTTSAVSVVNIGDGSGGTLLQVTHDYHPIAGTPYLYEVDVSIKNLSGSDLVAGDLVYRRVMDWDIPDPGFESVTIQGVPALLGIANGSNLYRSDNNGFNSGDPFTFSSYGLQDTNFTNSESGNLQGSISFDQGALFDFEFEALANGATRTFSTFYGVAPSVALADIARSLVDGDASDVDIGLYSYGTCTAGLTGFTCASVTGEPNTFIFGFGGTGGNLDPDPNPTIPEPVTLSLLGLGLAGLGLRRRKQEQTATLA